VRGYAALVAGFLHRGFVAPNARVMREVNLAEALETDYLFSRHNLDSTGVFGTPLGCVYIDYVLIERVWQMLVRRKLAGVSAKCHCVFVAWVITNHQKLPLAFDGLRSPY